MNSKHVMQTNKDKNNRKLANNKSLTFVGNSKVDA